MDLDFFPRHDLCQHYPLTCGPRLAFAPTLINRNLFVYGDNDAFIAKLPASLRRFGDRGYFTAIETPRKKYVESTVRIQHGPLFPKWVGDDALQEIKEQAKNQDTRIHIHILQTVLQMLYGQKNYGKSLLEHLYDISFFGKEVSCGHGVWLSERTSRSWSRQELASLIIRRAISGYVTVLTPCFPCFAIGFVSVSVLTTRN